MANNDDYKVPTTQGCSGHECGGLNQKDAENDSSVSKKNSPVCPDTSCSDCPVENTEDNDEKENPTKIDTYKDVEESKQLEKSKSSQCFGPTHTVNPYQPKNSPSNMGGGVPPTQGCVPNV